MTLCRYIRRYYPNTAKAVLYIFASVATLFFGPSRKWGELLLAVMAAVAVLVAGEKLWERYR